MGDKMATIAERAVRVLSMLGNRTDLVSKIEGWVRDAYFEFGMKYDFEELEETHNLAITGANNNNTYTYPTLTLNNNSWYVRGIKALTLFGNNNTRVIPLIKKDIKWLDRLPETQGSPAIFCSFKNSIIMHPTPNTDWTLRWRVWLKPRIEIEDNNNNLHMNSTEILLPEDWLELIDYGAALRGHVDLLERDKAGEIMQLLFGSEDPRNGRKIPGLISQRLLRRHAESPMNDWGMRPKRMGYTK
jgi:hypothetical protein